MTGPLNLTFWWKQTQTSGTLKFLIDGVEKSAFLNPSASAAWAQVSISLTPGVHTLRWQAGRATVTDSCLAYVDQLDLNAAFAPTGLVAWDSGSTIATPVVGDAVAVAAPPSGSYAYADSLALREGGTVVAWGPNASLLPTGLNGVVGIAQVQGGASR